MQHLQSLSLLEERITAAVELITYLKSEKKRLELDLNQLRIEAARLEAETARIIEAQRTMEKQNKELQDQFEMSTLEKDDISVQCDALRTKNEELARQYETLHSKQDEYQRFERDREEIRSRIDNMLAKFEELEV
jgi:chromosome segregation ATPase